MSAEEVLALLREAATRFSSGHLQNALMAHVHAGNDPSTFDFKKGIREAVEASAKVFRTAAELIERSL